MGQIYASNRAEATYVKPITPSTSSHLLVVAFDFGTTYSGYAFSFRDDPLKVQTNQYWSAGSEKLVSLKTPTCVLLTPDRQFHSFGYEAENKYSALAFDDKHSGWLLFRRFKMMLYNHKVIIWKDVLRDNLIDYTVYDIIRPPPLIHVGKLAVTCGEQKLSRTVQIDDLNGTPMPAMTIFAMSIRYMKEHFLALLNKQVTGVKETDIQYVLTVPAIWDDSAKQFMREAAIQAGIDTARLKLALEPEAASIWCQTLAEDYIGVLKESGTKYMVADLGGGTVDVTVHQTGPGGTLSELHKASGGTWGGTNVDSNYIEWIAQMYGRKAVERLKTEDMASFFDLLREFETNKRSVRFDQMEPLMFKSSVKDLSEDEGGCASVRLANADVVVKKDRMKIDPSIVKQWFNGPVECIIGHIKGILSEPSMDEVSLILLVGGFAESRYVQDKISHDISEKRFIIPNDAGLAVLKGAVRFGHEPSLISTRIMNYTYGVRMCTEYDSSKYPLSHIIVINGKEKVDNIFEKFVSAGETVKVGHEAIINATPTSMHYTALQIFCTTDPEPRFTTDRSCVELGRLEVEHLEGDTLKDKIMQIMITFGDTELKVKVRIIKTGNEFQTTIDCLK